MAASSPAGASVRIEQHIGLLAAAEDALGQLPVLAFLATCCRPKPGDGSGADADQGKLQVR